MNKPTLARAWFWLGLRGAPETAVAQEARERAAYELLLTRLRHPAGKARQ